jgi:hypothetical protein
LSWWTLNFRSFTSRPCREFQARKIRREFPLKVILRLFHLKKNRNKNRQNQKDWRIPSKSQLLLQLKQINESFRFVNTLKFRNNWNKLFPKNFQDQKSFSFLCFSFAIMLMIISRNCCSVDTAVKELFSSLIYDTVHLVKLVTHDRSKFFTLQRFTRFLNNYLTDLICNQENKVEF